MKDQKHALSQCTMVRSVQCSYEKRSWLYCYLNPTCYSLALFVTLLNVSCSLSLSCMLLVIPLHVLCYLSLSCMCHAPCHSPACVVPNATVTPLHVSCPSAVYIYLSLPCPLLRQSASWLLRVKGSTSLPYTCLYSFYYVRTFCISGHPLFVTELVSYLIVNAETQKGYQVSV